MMNSSSVKNMSRRTSPRTSTRSALPMTSTQPTVQDEQQSQPQQPAAINGALRWGYLSFAGLFFLLAIAGAFLPVLPTTPFLLLTSYFLTRCSPKLNQRLLQSRLFGPILSDWQTHHGIRPQIKKRAIIIVLLMVATSCYFTQPQPLVLAAILAITAIGLSVIIRLPTIANSSENETSK